MPIFCFACPQCKKVFEKIMPIHKTVKTQYCEVCGHQMDRAMEVPGRFIRGAGGWSSPPQKG